MKFQTPKTEIKKKYPKILSVGYCDLVHLLKYQKPCAYSTRAEGWACDYYLVDDVLISTGYSPINSKGIKALDYTIVREYESKARSIIENSELDYDEKRDMTNKLLSEFINLVNS